MDALCGMALLASAAHVVVEPGLDQGPVRVELRALRPPRGRLGAEVVHVAVLVDGVPAHAGLARDLGDAVPLPPQQAYRILIGHADHFLSGPPLVDTKHHQDSPAIWSACPLREVSTLCCRFCRFRCYGIQTLETWAR